MIKNKLPLGKWFEWAIFDDDGNMCGIREDAPDEYKQAYHQFIEKKNELNEKGIKA